MTLQNPETSAAAFPTTCCGGGGGGFLWDSPAKVNQKRWEQIQATGLKEVVTGCPGCHRMLGVMKDEESQISDVATVLLRDWQRIWPSDCPPRSETRSRLRPAPGREGVWGRFLSLRYSRASRGVGRADSSSRVKSVGKTRGRMPPGVSGEGLRRGQARGHPPSPSREG